MLPPLAAPLVALALVARPLAGQQVVGTVRDSASGRPVPGAVVLALDSLGRTLARGTTDQRGEYRVAAPAEARRIRVLRIGFRPVERARASGGAGARLDVSLASIPLLLGEVRVTAAPNCARRADRAAALALLDQVRAGLLATVVARAERAPDMTRLLFERRLAPGGDRITSQTVRVVAGRVTVGPFRAGRSGAAFVRHGFADDSAGARTFFAPDAETLSDEGFAAGYCFQLTPPDRARPHQVGLAFGAARPRTGRVDIAGALWVDTLARALRDLEFRYVGLEPELAALAPGGRLSFRELANGVVLLDRWSLRLVSGQLAARDTRITSTGQVAGARPPRLDVQESGGELARAAWPDGYAWTAPLGTLRVRATTSSGGPAAGAVIRLTSTDYVATTDAAGALELRGLLPGPYAAAVSDPQLSGLGVHLPTGLRFVAVRDSTVEARLRVETAEDFVARRCGAAPGAAGAALLLGRVVTPDGRPVPGARWTVRDAQGAVLVSDGQADGDGLFHWCGFAPGATVDVEAAHEHRRAVARRVLAGRLTTVRLELPPG